jgi:hypothetical protein
MRLALFLIAAIGLLAAGTAGAGTIYTWTDADGVKRYSNAQPPEGAENVQAIDEVEYQQSAGDQNRREFDRMVEEASREADQHFEQQKRQKALREEERTRRQEDAREEQIAAERARLLKEMETIQKRSLSPTFTKGMQDNLIQQVQEKIDRLEGGAGN